MTPLQDSKKLNFWEFEHPHLPAFLFPDGGIVSYSELKEDIESFTARITWDHGPFGLRCDGHYRQYVAYLAALNANCPVLLMGEKQGADTAGISPGYLYSPATDHLISCDAGASSWHPDLAVLLSTSGSTGSSKWVRLSHQNVSSNARSIAEYLALEPEDRAPMALPFQYSYGMSVVNSHLAVGAAIVLTEGSVSDRRFWETFERCGCTSLAGVPHSFELMGKAKIRTDHLDRLRYMTQAGGRLEPNRVRYWVERGQAEGWDFFVMYGQTEAAPRISYLPPGMALTTPSAIGIPIPGGEMWVEDADGEPLPDGAPGELFYRGPNTMMGYAQVDSDLRLGQGSDLLRTGDIARRLPSGVFEIVGRKSRFVKLFGLRIGLDEVEKYLQELGFEVACIARDEVLYVVVVQGAADAKGLDRRLSDWLGIPAASFRTIHVEALPRQGSGKVDLQAAGEMVNGMQAQISAEARSRQAHSGLRRLGDRILMRRRRSVTEVFQVHFPHAKVTSETSFESLGGDSLSYVAVSLELESVLGRLPRNWPHMSVAELESEAVEGRWITPVDTPTVIRALAIMMVVSGHFDFLEYGGGGANALMVVAGISFAAFTLPQVLQSASVIPVAVLTVRIALLSIGYSLLTYSVTGWGEWPAFFLIANWISPQVEGGAWFVEVYVQLLCVMMFVLAIPRVRAILQQHMFRMTALAAAALVVVAAASDMMVDLHHLFRRLPHLYAWMFMTGVAASLVRSTADRVFVTAVFLAGIWQFGGFKVILPTFFPIAVLILIWLPALPLPRFAASGCRMIAGASLIIYLSHFHFAEVSTRLFGDHAAVSWAFALVGGVMAWRLYDPIDVWLSHRLRALFSWKQT
jgi:acyl-CoA synthetase (AMP-forming)/AMP-acid ligase II